MSEFRQPLFILCPGRSFSSVVCAVIGMHPEAIGLPEVNLFRFATIGDMMDHASPKLGRPGLLTGLRRTLAELHHGEQTDETVAKVNTWLAERQDWTGGRMFREICRLAQPKVAVEKSPTNTTDRALRRLHDAFPDARFLHLSRHPRGTGQSRHKAFNKHRHKAFIKHSSAASQDHESMWLDRHARILDFSVMLRPDQYIFLHGEWFFEDPDAVLRQICEWLELSVDSKILARMKRPEDSPFSGYGPKTAATGNNPGFLENPTLRVGKMKEERLDGPLEWAKHENAVFSKEIVMLANMLGYR